MPRQHVDILTTDEVLAMLAVAGRGRTCVRARAMVAMMWRAALRPSEIVGCRLVDLDRKRSVVRLQKTKGDRARTVPLDAGTWHYLDAWLEARRGLQSRRLFCSLNGKPLDTSYLRRLLPRLAKRAGIAKRVHPGSLRHTCAVELDNDNVPVGVIQNVLGHARASTTAIYLQRHNATETRQAIESRPEWRREVRSRRAR